MFSAAVFGIFTWKTPPKGAGNIEGKFTKERAFFKQG
jgi:hypothetical protein